MSSVVNAIQNIAAVVVTILSLPTIVVSALIISAFTGASFEETMANSIEFIFGLFGPK